jgi:hypothetical protein
MYPTAVDFKHCARVPMQVRLLFLLILLATIAVAALADVTDARWALALLIAIIAVAGLQLVTREAPGFNPLYVCWILGVGVAVAAVIIGAMTVLPPAAVAVIAVMLTAAALAVTLFSRGNVREHRAVSGLCVECGYDLRESEVRCPECGAPIPEELSRRRRIAADLAAERARAEGDVRQNPEP